jgi:uncharacterized protein (DUF2062 family)
MAKKIIQRFMPDQETIKEHKHLQFLGDQLHEPNLWHLNRHSVAKAFAIGLFVAWLPIPGQMVVAAFAALYLRANLAISVALVWITNPLTWVPLFYFAYRVGLGITGLTPPAQNFNFTYENAMIHLDALWAPLFLGSLLLSSVCATTGYFGIQYLWRWYVTKKWQHRRNLREQQQL